MKEEVDETLDEIIELLVACGAEGQADWFRSKQKVLRAAGRQSAEYRRELAELRGIIAGMGSFTDLSLQPGYGSRLTAREARERQWDLAERLGAAIDEELKTSTP